MMLTLPRSLKMLMVPAVGLPVVGSTPTTTRLVSTTDGGTFRSDAVGGDGRFPGYTVTKVPVVGSITVMLATIATGECVLPIAGIPSMPVTLRFMTPALPAPTVATVHPWALLP